MTSLEMVYTRDGLLALLKQHPCPGQHASFGGIMHSSCGCTGPNHDIYKVAAVHVLQPGEADWVWHRCPTSHQADV